MMCGACLRAWRMPPSAPNSSACIASSASVACEHTACTAQEEAFQLRLARNAIIHGLISLTAQQA